MQVGGGAAKRKTPKEAGAVKEYSSPNSPACKLIRALGEAIDGAVHWCGAEHP